MPEISLPPAHKTIIIPVVRNKHIINVPHRVLATYQVLASFRHGKLLHRGEGKKITEYLMWAGYWADYREHERWYGYQIGDAPPQEILSVNAEGWVYLKTSQWLPVPLTVAFTEISLASLVKGGWKYGQNQP